MITKQEFADLMLVFFGPRRLELRLGQHMFNTLSDCHSDICIRVIPNNSEGCDPFYRDDLIPAFLLELSNHVEW